MAEETEASSWKYSKDIDLVRKAEPLKSALSRADFLDYRDEILTEQKKKGLRRSDFPFSVSRIEDLRVDLLHGLAGQGLPKKTIDTIAQYVEDKDLKIEVEELLAAGGQSWAVMDDVVARFNADIAAQCRLPEPKLVRSFRHYEPSEHTCLGCKKPLPAGSQVLAWVEDYRAVTERSILPHYTRTFTLIPSMVFSDHSINVDGMRGVRTQSGNIFTLDTEALAEFMGKSKDEVLGYQEGTYVQVGKRIHNNA